MDFRGDVRLSHLFQWMTQLAGQHAEHLGVGFHSLQEKNLFWVLARITLEINRFPLWHEKVKLQTWPKGVHRLFAMRDFQFFDEHDKLLAGATTAWLLLDGRSKRPQRLQGHLDHIPAKSERHGVTGFPEALQTPHSDGPCHRIRARYSHLDVNRHVNNTKYLDWILDCLELDFLNEHEASRIQLNFLAEGFFNDEVWMYKEALDGHEPGFLIQGVRTKDQETLFQAEISFRRRVN